MSNHTPSLLAGRYAITDEIRVGGMSTVQMAYDVHTRKNVAIKRPKLAKDERTSKESFNREYRALSELGSHPNIVSLLDVSADDVGPYMVLEWIDENLSTWIQRHPNASWEAYYPEIGKPLLGALAFAQSRSWVHRDLKPANVLITSEGVPKLADFGIAKQITTPNLGATFRTFKSIPFSPPEDETIRTRLSRDGFAWAAVTVSYLGGKIPENYGDLDQLIGALDQSAVPVSLLRGALSFVPEERPESASVLLTDLDIFYSKAHAHAVPALRLHLTLSDNVQNSLARITGLSDRREIESAVLEELSEVQVGTKLQTFPNGRNGFRFFCVELMLDVVQDATGSRLSVVSASKLSSADVERIRENCFRPKLTFSFDLPANRALTAEDLLQLHLNTLAFEAAERDRQAEAEKERIFRVWQAFLRAKGDFEERRQNAIEYVATRQIGGRIALTTTSPTPPDLAETSRLIRLPSGSHFFCEIVDINLDEVIVAPSFGDVGSIPRRGLLEVNTIAAERAIERQRRALNSINSGSAASSYLRSVIADPGTARAPLQITAPIVADRHFDEDKREILQSALGLQDVLAIEGPPGTGKTRLIEEIVVQYLTRHPDHRILISSQTHVALDNVISRVRLRQPTLEIVRVGKLGDEKISAESRDLIIERKAVAWSEGVRGRAQNYLRKWAADHSLPHSDIELGVFTEKLIRLLEIEAQIKENLDQATEVARKSKEELLQQEAAITSTQPSTSSDARTLEAETTIGTSRRALEPIRIKIEEVKEKLRTLGSYGVDLANLDNVVELREWSEALLGQGHISRQCKRLIELQESWLERVGHSSDFNAAMLSSAQIVAGTCVGMAGLREMSEVTYDLCIVDEASKATATEILVPMARSKKWVLVGDPQQLPPFFEDESLVKLAGFDEEEVRKTLFDRFLKSLPEHSRPALTKQHRMVRAIGDLVSHAFYNDRLDSPILKPRVVLTGSFPKPVTWVSTSGAPNSMESFQRGSYRNDFECELIRRSLAQLDFIARNRKAIYEIGVVAGYVAQVRALQDLLRDYIHLWPNLKITCSTIDAFQGSEVEICFYSVTRSNRDGRLGFLRETPRLNVALSRARSALIIVGDDEFCRSIVVKNPFRKVLDYIDSNPGICELRRI